MDLLKLVDMLKMDGAKMMVVTQNFMMVIKTEMVDKNPVAKNIKEMVLIYAPKDRFM
ncbi:MAG: hypothetical protein HEEMFOPI_01908 [Holosporales bacterium]